MGSNYSHMNLEIEGKKERKKERKKTKRTPVACGMK